MRLHLRASNIARRAIAAIGATAVAFAMLGTGALAAAPVVHDHISSSSAAATNTVCAGTICTATSVFVIVDSSGGASQACLDMTRYDSVAFVVLGYETGCAPLAPAGFSIDTKALANAALSPIDITLQAFTCGASGCVPTGATRVAQVSATYAGVGDTNTFRANSKSTFRGCTMYFVGKGSSRDATATLTVGTESLSGVGSLFTSTQMIKVLCH
ncbi:MAG: hypothetical protein E6J23_12175 [Chloroflexi bacterium]|nr:MAG: hypothetical protein E6J23_12175 [Chloroflexota bacterium]